MVVFSEDHIQETRRRGRIEVICGSMFSGKTEELIRRLKRAKFARQRVEIFKPAIDTRYSEEEVVSHDSNSIASTPIDSSASILLFSSDKSHCRRIGHGFRESSFRTYTCLAGYCRRSNQSSCHLCEMWELGLCHPPNHQKRKTGPIRGKGRL